MEIDMTETARPFYNVGPGEVIQDALDALGWTQEDLADVSGLTHKTVNQIINNRQSITIETAQLFARVFQTSPELWLHLNDAYQIRKHEAGPREHYAAYKGLLRRFMPLSEMRKKGWLVHDDNLEGLKKDCRRIFGKDILTEDDMAGALQFCARRSRTDEQYTAWYSATWYRIARLNALAIDLPAFDLEAFATLCARIPGLTLMDDGLQQFIKGCLSCGVGFFVQSHLQKTYLDGAAFIVNRHPFIVYTARYNRIDNFWYTVSHEAAHVLLHLDGNETPILDNLDSPGTSAQEQEADAQAADWLNTGFVVEEGKKIGKYLTGDRLAELSQKAGLSTPVVLGILQHAKVIDWRRFAPYREPVLDMIPAELQPGLIEQGLQ